MEYVIIVVLFTCILRINAFRLILTFNCLVILRLCFYSECFLSGFFNYESKINNKLNIRIKQVLTYSKNSLK